MHEELESRERVCPICGKHFILPSESIYKLKVNGKSETYCSYTCYREVQKKLESSKRGYRKNR